MAQARATALPDRLEQVLSRPIALGVMARALRLIVRGLDARAAERLAA